MRLLLPTAALLAQPAAGYKVLMAGLQPRTGKALDPFDCFTEKGEKYVGLQDAGQSGRKCANWRDTEHSDLDHNSFCRNPTPGAMEGPWCFVVGATGKADTKELCTVPVCKPSELNPEKWVGKADLKVLAGPDAGKMDKAPKPCEHTQQYTNFKLFVNNKNKACHKGYGGKQWLIDYSLVKAADAAACAKECGTKSGAEYMTFWAGKAPVAMGRQDKDGHEGDNCGCYRDSCSQKEGPGELAAVVTLGKPTTYKLGHWKVAGDAAKAKAGPTSKPPPRPKRGPRGKRGPP